MKTIFAAITDQILNHFPNRDTLILDTHTLSTPLGWQKRDQPVYLGLMVGTCVVHEIPFDRWYTRNEDTTIITLVIIEEQDNPYFGRGSFYGITLRQWDLANPNTNPEEIATTYTETHTQLKNNPEKVAETYLRTPQKQ